MPCPNRPDANETVTLLLNPEVIKKIQFKAWYDGVSVDEVVSKALQEALNKLEHNESAISTQHLSEGTGDRSLPVR